MWALAKAVSVLFFLFSLYGLQFSCLFACFVISLLRTLHLQCYVVEPLDTIPPLGFLLFCLLVHWFGDLTERFQWWGFSPVVCSLCRFSEGTALGIIRSPWDDNGFSRALFLNVPFPWSLCQAPSLSASINITIRVTFH